MKIGLFRTVVAKRLKLLDNDVSGDDRVGNKLTEALPLVVSTADGGTEVAEVAILEKRSQHKATILS
jgi:hypothetical protein